MCAETADWLQPKLLDGQQVCCCSCTHLTCRQDCNGKQLLHQRLSACRYLGATYDGSSSGKHGVVTGADVPRLAYESFPLCMLVSRTHNKWNEDTRRLCHEGLGPRDDVVCQGYGGPSVMHHGPVTCLPVTQSAGSFSLLLLLGGSRCMGGVWQAVAAMQPPFVLRGPAPPQRYCNLKVIAGICYKSCAMV